MKVCLVRALAALPLAAGTPALLGFVFAALLPGVVLANQAPTGVFDRLDNATVHQSGEVSGAGWAADYEMGAPIDHISIRIDGVPVSAGTSLNGVRNDVQASNVANGNNISPLDVTHSGWAFSYNIGTLSLGGHTVMVDAWDNQGASNQIGIKNFTATPNTPPVGMFDRLDSATVNQGAVVSGAGWAADYEMGAPIDHLTILIDGATVSASTSLNGVRNDVQTNNVNTGNSFSPLDVTHSGWAFSYNVGTLSLGGHTVSVVAWDDLSASRTIGTRNFTVSSSSTTAPESDVPAMPLWALGVLAAVLFFVGKKLLPRQGRSTST